MVNGRFMSRILPSRLNLIESHNSPIAKLLVCSNWLECFKQSDQIRSSESKLGTGCLTLCHKNCTVAMSSQMFDTQQFLETQIDDDSQDLFFIPPSPADKPDDNLGAGSAGSVPSSAHKKEVEEAATAAEDAKDSSATSVASCVPRTPEWVQQYLGQRKADAWTDMPRKFRGVMNHTCQPAA